MKTKKHTKKVEDLAVFIFKNVPPEELDILASEIKVKYEKRKLKNDLRKLREEISDLEKQKEELKKIIRHGDRLLDFYLQPETSNPKPAT